MATSAPRPCTWSGCGELVRDGKSRCPAHRRQADQERGTAAERGYTSAWTKAREAFLRAHPLCAEHQRKATLVAATVVDHIVPHRGDKALFWDRQNWQSLCKHCHDSKTAREDGGFGRARAG